MNENYEDYEEKLDNTEYDNDDDNSTRNKRILLIALVIVAIIIIILLLRACGNGKTKEFDYEKTLLEAGKEYYEYNGNEVPKAKSSCKTVSLNKLVSEGLLDPKKYADCDGEDTYVKVCLLENGKEHYVPILACDKIDSNELYDDFDEGKISDIKADETDIKYSYLGQVLKGDKNNLGDITEIWYGDKIPYANYKLLGKTTYYRYRDLQYKWYETANLYYPNDTLTGGKELYIVSPENGYNGKDNEQTASKWYKLVGTGDKIYYDEYSAEAPQGYPYPDTSQGYTVASRTRIITGTSASSSFAALKMYRCIETENKNSLTAVYSNEYNACGSTNNAHPEHDYELETFYSCDGGDNKVVNGTTCYKCNTGSLRPDNTCATYTNWEYAGSACTGENDICQNLVKPVNYYKWFKYSNETRSYYPSGSTTAAGEKTYYASAPENGYIKDDATTTTAWNWYKGASTLTANYITLAPSINAVKSSDSRWTEWTDWSANVVQGLGSAGTRSIETKVKLRIQEIKNIKNDDYENIMEKYTEDENVIIKAFKDKGYEVETLEDIAMNGELKYLTKMYIRNKK